MDTGLKLACEQCCRIINSYLESIDPRDAPKRRLEQFHLVQAKQALTKVLALNERTNFNARRLAQLYEDQLRQISELYHNGK